MPKLTKTFPKLTTWEDLQSRLVKCYRLPYGSSFALLYDAHPRYGDRKVRSEFQVRRRRIARAEHDTSAPGQLRVSEILDRIRRMLAIDLDKESMIIAAFGPGKVRLAGNKTLAKWREIEPDLTPEQRQAERMRLDEINTFIAPMCRSALDEVAEGIEDPETKIPQAMLAELFYAYGRETVRDAVREIGLG